MEFNEMNCDELSAVLDLTIKADNVNKIITFLTFLSAYTEDSQMNLMLNSPSSTGKSYIPSEVSKLFPVGDVLSLHHVTPTAFFHDEGTYNPKTNEYFVNLERKILFFLDQPNMELLKRLRPLLSHDQKEIKCKITDKTGKHGLKTKNVTLRGFPVVVYCSANPKFDEQEATRFITISAEISPEKIEKGITAVVAKGASPKEYKETILSNPARQLLIARIEAIKELMIQDVKLHNQEELRSWFLKRHVPLKPRHQRDINRFISIMKSLALLNAWHRNLNEGQIITNETDFQAACLIWESMGVSNEFNVSPYVFDVYTKVLVPLYRQENRGLRKDEIARAYYEVFKKHLSEWQLTREIIPALSNGALINVEQDPNDRRRALITPLI